MNCTKTCVALGKKEPTLVCDELIKALNTRLNENNSEILIRFIQIFDELLLSSESVQSLAHWTDKFVLFCSDYIQSVNFELRCAIINYYINVLNGDFSSFIHNQKNIWDRFNLSQKTQSDCNLELEGK